MIASRWTFRGALLMAVVACSATFAARIASAQTTYYFNNSSGNSGKWDDTTANWGLAEGTGTAIDWLDGSNAIFWGGSAGSITLNNVNVNPDSIDVQTTGYTFAPSTSNTALAINFSGSAPVLELGVAASGTFKTTFNAPVTSTSQLTINNQASNGSGAYKTDTLIFASANDAFTGGLLLTAPNQTAQTNGWVSNLSTTTDTFRLDFNVTGANGTGSTAGPIDVAANGVLITNAGSLPAFTLNMSNNIVLNYANLTGAALGMDATGTVAGTFQTAIGGTKSNSGNTTIIYSGQITDPFAQGTGAGVGSVVITNSLGPGSGGAGITEFSGVQKTYSGQTIMNGSVTAVFQMGLTNVLPTGTTLIFGNSIPVVGVSNGDYVTGQGAQTNSVGALDLNGYSQTIASLQSALDPTAAINGITNTSSTIATLTITGSTVDYYYGAIGISAGVVATGISNNNEALIRTGTGTTVIGNALNGASSTYVGDTNVGDATHTGCTLEAGSYTALSQNSNYIVDAILDLGNYNNTINSLASTTGNTTGVVTTSANSITNPNSPSGGATLTIGSNTTANAITAPTTTFNGSLQNGSGGPLALVKGGAGTQILTGTSNSYSGGTTVNDGVLTINGALTSATNAVTVNGGTLNGTGSIAGAVAVNAAATLGGTLSIANAVTINTSANISPGTSGVAGTLTIGGLTLNGGSNYNWKVTNAGGTAGSGYDTVAATGITIGSAALSTPINVDASILDPSFDSAVSGQWTLASSTAAVTLPTMPNGVTVSNLFNAFTPSNVFGNFTVTQTGATDNNLTLNYTPVSLQTLTWQGGTGAWQPAGTSGDTAWNNGVSNGPFSLSSIAEFAAGSGGGTVTLGNNVSAAVIRFDTTGFTIAGGTSNFTLSDAPSSGVTSLDVQVTNASDSATISAAVVSPLTKFGAGTLILSGGGGANGNTFGGTGGNPGTLTVYAGTLRGGSTSLNANINNIGTVTFDQSDITTGSYAAAITGTGSVVVQNSSGVGTPVLTFSGASAYTGGTTINSNVTLAVSSAANLGATANITYPYGTIAAATGTLTLNGGTLQPTAGITLAGLLNVTANSAINDGASALVNYINGGANLQPGVTLTKNGSGTLVIPDVGWTGSGTLVINQGSLIVGDESNFQANPSTFFGGNSLVLNNGTTLTIAAGTASTASITPPKLTLNGNTTIQLFNTGGVTGAGPLNPSLNSVTTVNPGSNTASSTITFQGAAGSGLSGSSTITLGNTTFDTTSGIITIQTVANSGTNGASTGVTFGAVTDNGDTIQFLGQGNATNSAQYVAPGSGVQFNGVTGTTATMTGQWIIGDPAGVNAQIVVVAVQKVTNPNLAMTTGNILVNPGSQLDITSLLATGANSYGPSSGTQTITLNGLGPVNSSLTGTTSALSLDAKAQAEFNSHVNLVLGSSTMINLTAGSSTQATIMTFDGLISGSPGTTLTLHGDNNYSPPVQSQPILTQLIFNGTTSLAGVNTVLEGGQIVVNSTASLGSGDLTFAQITTRNTDVQLNNATQSIGNLSSTWDSGGSGATQTLELNRAASSGGTTLTINETGVTDFGNDGIPNGSGDTASIIGGSKANIIFAGTAGSQLTLSGLNTYGGYTEITGGTLSATMLANGGSGNPSGIGNSSNSAINLVISGGTLQYASQVSPGVAATTDRLFTIGLNGAMSPMFATLDASGASGDSITWTGNGTGSADAIAFGTTTEPATLTLTGSSTDSNTLAPIIGDSGGSSPGSAVTSLVKSGVGTWILTAANTYTGGTTINGGTLITSGSGTLGGSGPLSISAASETTSTLNLANSQSVSSLTTSQSGGGTATILVGPGATLTTPSFSNTGALNVGATGSAAGTVLVIGASTLNSNSSLLVNSGTLEFNGSTAATVGTNVTATVASSATLQLAGSAPALSSSVNVVNNGSAASGGGLSVIGTNQIVGTVSGTASTGDNPTTYGGDTVVGNGISPASLTAAQILQNTLTINAGSTVTIAPSGPGISSGVAVASDGTSSASVSDAVAVSDSESTAAGIADPNDPLTAIQAAIASGSISSVKGTQLENRIAAIDQLATKDPGLDVSLLESRVLAAINPQPVEGSASVWSASSSPLVATDTSLLTIDSDTSASALGGASASFAPAGGFGGSPAAVPEPSSLLLASLAALGLGGLVFRRRRMDRGPSQS